MTDPENERSGRGFGFNPRFYGRRFHHVELERLLDEVGDLDFASKIVRDSKQLEPEFAKIINDKFWDLI